MEQDQPKDLLQPLSPLKEDSFFRSVIQDLIAEEERKCKHAMENGAVFETIKAIRLQVKYLRDLLK